MKSAIFCGSVGVADPAHQLGSVPLDAMVYMLLAKHSGQGVRDILPPSSPSPSLPPSQTLSSLLSTMVKRITQGSHDDHEDAVGVASCFLRSVIRVWSVCELETATIPHPSSSSSTPPSRRHSSKSGVSERAFFAFSSLAPHSIPALLDSALASITPVMRGVARPVDPLSMADRHKVAEEMFRLPPVSLLRELPSDDMSSELYSISDDVMMMSYR